MSAKHKKNKLTSTTQSPNTFIAFVVVISSSMIQTKTAEDWIDLFIYIFYYANHNRAKYL